MRRTMLFVAALCLTLPSLVLGYTAEEADVSVGQNGEMVYIHWFADTYESSELQDHDFTVKYRPVGSTQWETYHAGQSNHAAISGLSAGVEYEFELTSISPSNVTSSWPAAQTHLVREHSAVPEVSQAGDFDLEVINFQNIPYSGGRFNTMEVRLDSAGVSWPYLEQGQFEVYEDGVLQTDGFTVDPPDTPCTRAADIVFLIDNSGSMCPERNAVVNNSAAFVDSLNALGVDVRLWAVRFGQSSNGGHPLVLNACNPTDNVNTFKSWVAGMTCDGGYEYGLEAVHDILDCITFRPGSSRQFVIITDEDSDGGDLTTAISRCNSAGVKVHVRIDPNFGSTYSHYSGPNGIAQRTGGSVSTVTDNFWVLLDEITEGVCENYIISYVPDNQDCDGQIREVVVRGTSGPHSGEDTVYYTPCMCPVIELTEATKTLLATPLTEYAPLTIEAIIVDNVAPFIQSATLWYKTTGAAAYKSIPMSNTGGDIYSATIPGADVVRPGIDFYIAATDGECQTTDPSSDAAIKPFQSPVLPNVAPIINHDTLGPTQPVNIDLAVDAEVLDNTNQVAWVKLFYRRYGQLLFTEVAMGDVGGDMWDGVIPQSVNQPGGCEYYIAAADDYGVTSYHGTADDPHQINIGSAPCGDGAAVGGLRDTVYAPFEQTISAILDTAYLWNLPDGHVAADINMASLVMNSGQLPNSVWMETASIMHGGQDVVAVEIDITELVANFGRFWGVLPLELELAGSYNDAGATPFYYCKRLIYRGHALGDLNRDGVMDPLDLSLLVEYLYTAGPAPLDPEAADLNYDGTVGPLDLAMMVAAIFEGVDLSN